MKLTIEGDTKEITALVLALQERRLDEETASKIIAHLQAAIDQSEDVLYADGKPQSEQTQVCDYESGKGYKQSRLSSWHGNKEDWP